jgi:hypothetical protein
LFFSISNNTTIIIIPKAIKNMSMCKPQSRITNAKLSYLSSDTTHVFQYTVAQRQPHHHERDLLIAIAVRSCEMPPTTHARLTRWRRGRRMRSQILRDGENMAAQWATRLARLRHPRPARPRTAPVDVRPVAVQCSDGLCQNPILLGGSFYPTHLPKLELFSGYGSPFFPRRAASAHMTKSLALDPHDPSSRGDLLPPRAGIPPRVASIIWNRNFPSLLSDPSTP